MKTAYMELVNEGGSEPSEVGTEADPTLSRRGRASAPAGSEKAQKPER